MLIRVLIADDFSYQAERRRRNPLKVGGQTLGPTRGAAGSEFPVDCNWPPVQGSAREDFHGQNSRWDGSKRWLASRPSKRLICWVRPFSRQPIPLVPHSLWVSMWAWHVLEMAGDNASGIWGSTSVRWLSARALGCPAK
jgi:hypothetical protein